MLLIVIIIPYYIIWNWADKLTGLRFQPWGYVKRGSLVQTDDGNMAGWDQQWRLVIKDGLQLSS